MAGEASRRTFKSLMCVAKTYVANFSIARTGSSKSRTKLPVSKFTPK